jgi:hypothetical protein
MEKRYVIERYQKASTFEEFAEGAEANQELWRAVRARASVPAEIVRRVEALPGSWHLLVLTEDWCGDAVNTVPLVAALADAARNLDARLLERDENLDLMDTHLTNGSRSIPVVIVLNGRYEEVGWWGPRPRDLQAWVMTEGKRLPTEDRYREVRKWYARDRGLTTLEELVSLLEAAAGEPITPGGS